MIHITYSGPCLDSSGYATAARNNICALHSVGVKIKVNPISFERDKTDHGEAATLCQRLMKNTVPGDIQIIHATPENYPRIIQKGKYNIGYAAWETSRLPDHWLENIQHLQEIWVPSQYNVELFRNSGVTIPIHCMPHPFVTREQKADVAPIQGLQNKDSEEFAFYSIFQWLERKNPIGLLKAYLTEFTREERVVLVMKTFVNLPGQQSQADPLRKMIYQVRDRLYLSSYPKILLISTLLSQAQIESLHDQCDCYVSLHRSEGFGIPLAEAMLHGNPVIATGYSGNVDFMQHKKTGYLVNHQLTPVGGMPWSIYRGNAEWAEPDLMHARRIMREVFENQKQAKKVGQAGQRWVERNLSFEAVGQKMKDRLEVICAEI